VALSIDVSTTSVCSISGGLVSFTGSGTCTIDANQAGDATYAPATEVQQSLAVTSGGGGDGVISCIFPAPLFVSASNVHVVVGERLTFKITTVGCPNPVVEKPATLPKHVRFVPSSDGLALLVGRILVPAGSYPLVLKAVNSNGTTTQGFTLVVAAAAT
jgi:hypothetical protein